VPIRLRAVEGAMAAGVSHSSLAAMSAAQAAAAVEAAGGVEVQVRDEVGHVASARWRPPVVALRGEGAEAAGGVGAASGGCAAAGGSPLVVLVGMLLAGTRPRKKQENI